MACRLDVARAPTTIRRMVMASADVNGSGGLSATRFEVSFIDQEGVLGRGLFADCGDWSFEEGKPVRRLVSRRGSRGFPGLWRFSTTSEHAGYESRLERDHLMAHPTWSALVRTGARFEGGTLVERAQGIAA
jgi:hypothetical protein